MTGTVKKIVAERGFGFITAEDGQEYFFHRSGLDSSLTFENLAGDERAGKPVFGDPQAEHAASQRCRLENRDRVAHQSQIVRR